MTEPVLHRRASQVAVVEEPSNDLELRALLAAGECAAALSITSVRIDGHHRRLRSEAGTRIYLVQDGSGVITVAYQAIEVAAGDLVVIPRGTPYHLDGTMEYLVINQPGFRAGDDQYLEEPAS